jgi:predicted molibdopterin-dependent oxidoreductase YjgC
MRPPAAGSAPAADLRLPGARGARCVIQVDGTDVVAYEGEPVAAAVLAGGARAFRLTDRDRAPRAYFCGMGVCHDCLMTVDGRGHVRTCMEPVRPGMRIETQAPRRPDVIP